MNTRISEIVEREKLLYATRATEGFLARRLEDNEQLMLWMFRHPFPPEVVYRERFCNRLERLRGVHPTLPKFYSMGIDESGVGYLLCEYVPGTLLLAQEYPVERALVLFTSVVRLIAELHELGFAFGDFSEQSFLLDEKNEIHLISLLGASKLDPRKTSSLPPSEALHYSSPEQRDGAAPSLAVDVYALGILGFRLVSGAYPRELTAASPGQTIVVPPSSYRAGIPTWFDQAIATCLSAEPEKRFHQASELLNALLSGQAQDEMGKELQQRNTEPSKAAEFQDWSSGQESQSEPINRETWSRANDQKKKALRRRRNIQIGISLLLLMLVFALGSFFIIRGKEKPTDEKIDHLQIQQRIASEDVAPLIGIVSDAERPISEREAALHALALKKDVAAFETFVTILEGGIQDRDAQRISAVARRAFTERLQHFGYKKTASVLSSLLLSLEVRGLKADTLRVLGYAVRAAEPTSQMQVRVGALRDVHGLSTHAGLELAAALSFDDPAGKQFESVVREFIKKELPGESIDDKSIYALMLVYPQLADVFDEQKTSFIAKMSNDDLRWAITRAANFDSPILFSLAEEVLKRDLLSSYHRVFLVSLIDAGRFQTSRVMQRALIRGAFGELTDDDVSRIAEWEGDQVEAVFLAACATLPPGKEALSAFDTFAVRTLASEPGASLMRWVKANYWEQRAALIRTVGILALHSIAAPSDLADAFRKISGIVATERSFFDYIAEVPDSAFQAEVVNHLSADIPDSVLVGLLSNPASIVRIAAVQALRKTNEISALQSIRRSYEKERDPAVRKVYEQVHWVTHRERE